MKQKVRLNIERACNWSSQRIIKVIIYKLTSLEEYVGFCIDLLELIKEKMNNETEKITMKQEETNQNLNLRFMKHLVVTGHMEERMKKEKGTD